MRLKVIGEGETIIGIVGCLHGDERIGEKILGRIMRTGIQKNLRLKLIVANEEAMKRNSRFIESDLNRSFNAGNRKTIEEKLAIRIDEELSDCDYVIDLHSTHADMESAIITTTDTFARASVKHLINCVPVKKIVIMSAAIGRGRSLIDAVKTGVSIEFGKEVPFEKAFGVVDRTIRNLSEGRTSKLKRDTFKTTGFVDGPAEAVRLHNFVLVNKGRQFMMRRGKPVCARYSFYPIFVGEGGYKNKVCIAARKVS
jgi:succinylglutamate desuccinylase